MCHRYVAVNDICLRSKLNMFMCGKNDAKVDGMLYANASTVPS